MHARTRMHATIVGSFVFSMHMGRGMHSLHIRGLNSITSCYERPIQIQFAYTSSTASFSLYMSSMASFSGHFDQTIGHADVNTINSQSGYQQSGHRRMHHDEPFEAKLHVDPFNNRGCINPYFIRRPVTTASR